MIGIITIIDNNIGNRLQNFAVCKLLSNYSNVYTIIFENKNKNKFLCFIKKIIKKFFVFFIKNEKSNFYKRNFNFSYFNRIYIPSLTIVYKEKNVKSCDESFDTFVVGSDQVWNPNFFSDMSINMLSFTKTNKKIALAPSIGVIELTDNQKSIFAKNLSDFKLLSCREEQGSKIIKEITGRECTTLIDPTLMLSKEEWSLIEKKPIFHDETKKYILLYFLGNITQDYDKFINLISEKYNLQIINIYDKKSIYYSCGPSEFIYLINHSSLILTDSFHASVFSYIFDKPLKIFNRIDDNKNMNSRLINLINILELPQSIFFDINNCEINKILDKPNYDKTNLKKEQEKFYNYLDRAFK